MYCKVCISVRINWLKCHLKRGRQELPVSVPFHWHILIGAWRYWRKHWPKPKIQHVFSPNYQSNHFLGFPFEWIRSEEAYQRFTLIEAVILFLKAIYKSGYQSPRRRSFRYRKAGHATTIGKFFRINMRSAPCIKLHGFNLKTGPYPLCLVYYSGDFKDYNT